MSTLLVTLKRFWRWVLSFFVKYYEVTIWFEGATIVNPDGSKTTNRDPKTYCCKKILKLTDKHIKLIERDGSRIEIKTVHPVGFDVKQPKELPDISR